MPKRSALIWKHIEEANREKQHGDFYVDLNEYRMHNARRIKNRIHNSIRELQEEVNLILSI